MEHKRIKSANGEVHYWIKRNENADAGCIVFTHGMTAGHTMYEKQFEYFEDNYTIVAWDVPMHGLSMPYKDFSFRQAAVELNNILENEDIKRVVLVGMSMGGYPSQMFASMYPEKVAGFVALDTTPFGKRYYSKTDLWWLKRVGDMAGWYPDKMIEIMKPFTKAQIIEQMDAAYKNFVIENIDVEFNFPVLILLADGDTIGKVSQYCRAWSEHTGYPLHIIENAAHFSNGDNPEQVNRKIEEFVNSLL